tara:strand:- start:1437 stop:1922 length:486 start_codon:yes stop_codon:yes gene_type:complete
MDVVIRLADIKDSEEILKLIKELAEFENELEKVELNLMDIKNDGFGKNPIFICFVAEYLDSIVGIALFYPRYSTWKGPTFHLEDLIVTKTMKGKGIGTKLLYAFVNYAKNEGVKRVEWEVLDWNKKAIDFYNKNGAVIFNDWKIVKMSSKSMINFLAKNKS